MKVSGFSFVRDAVRYGFPLRESLMSLVPLCDEIVVAVGESSDGTLDLVRSLDPKIRTIPTVWDENLRTGGRIYAQQTDVALAECTGDWCIYLQADEVLHEDDTDLIRHELQRAWASREVEGLLFTYLHFYGSYDFVATDRTWYRREIRVVRNTGRVVSWGDGQGFRTIGNDGSARKLKARSTAARIFHYGWVRPPRDQAEKMIAAHRYWHDDAWIDANVPSPEAFDYNGAYRVERFDGTHPLVMHERIRNAAWSRGFDPSRTRPRPMAMRISDAIERLTGYRIGEYRNYEVVR